GNNRRDRCIDIDFLAVLPLLRRDDDTIDQSQTGLFDRNVDVLERLREFLLDDGAIESKDERVVLALSNPDRQSLQQVRSLELDRSAVPGNGNAGIQERFSALGSRLGDGVWYLLRGRGVDQLDIMCAGLQRSYDCVRC